MPVTAKPMKKYKVDFTPSNRSCYFTYYYFFCDTVRHLVIFLKKSLISLSTIFVSVWNFPVRI